MNRYEIKFWILLLLLNLLLFVPAYLFNLGTSHFLPIDGFFHGSLYARLKTIFIRPDLDIFRISVDLFLIVFIYYAVRKYVKPGMYGWFAGIYYIMMFLFLAYFNGFEKLYHIPPVLYNDLSLAKLLFYNIGGNSVIKSVIFLLLVLTFLYVLIWAIRKLINYTYYVNLSIYSKSILILTGLLLCINTLKSGFTYAPDQAFQETLGLMVINLKNSAEAHKSLGNFNVDRINKQLNYNSYKLKSRPDIYLLFVESYGKVLFTNTYLKEPFLKCLDSCRNSLAGKGWNMASVFSISPVSGGQSWISYTTVLFGYNVRNQGTFNSLLKNSSMEHYDNIFNFLRKKGYRTFRLNAMPQNPDMEIPWRAFSDFYSIDKWINFKDLNYSGSLYGFGPSPPDQYSINYAGEFIRQNFSGPHALFFITQTTHHPFYSPDSVVTNWRSLNYIHHDVVIQSSVFLKKPRISDYLKATRYDLSALCRFISTTADSNAIFILIGDHQPPVIAGNQDGFETPVHIICRNPEFTTSFLNYGFQKGLRPGINLAPIRHESICSMFIREFLRFYGTDPSKLPEYHPYGLITNTL